MIVAHSSDLPDQFFADLVGVGNRLQVKPIDLLSVWMYESVGVHSHIMNPNGCASGLCQMMPDTAKEKGWRPGDPRWEQIEIARGLHTKALSDKDSEGAQKAQETVHSLEKSIMGEFAALGPCEQLPWCERYYAPYRGRLPSATAVYVATFMPIHLAHACEPNFVLCGVHGPYAWAYTPNRGFDVDKKDFINVRDLTNAITRACQGARWDEISARMFAATGEDLPNT